MVVREVVHLVVVLEEEASIYLLNSYINNGTVQATYISSNNKGHPSDVL